MISKSCHFIVYRSVELSISLSFSLGFLFLNQTLSDSQLLVLVLHSNQSLFLNISTHSPELCLEVSQVVLLHKSRNNSVHHESHERHFHWWHRLYV